MDGWTRNKGGGDVSIRANAPSKPQLDILQQAVSVDHLRNVFSSRCLTISPFSFGAKQKNEIVNGTAHTKAPAAKEFHGIMRCDL
jgi:hypothetical protein